MSQPLIAAWELEEALEGAHPPRLLDCRARLGQPDAGHGLWWKAHLPGSHQVGNHVRQLELQRLEGRQRLTKLLALVHIIPGPEQGRLGTAQGTGGDIQAAAVQALHRNGKAIAFITHQIAGRHANVFQGNQARGLAMPPHLFLILAVGDTVGIRWYHEGRDALRAAVGVSGARHQNQNIGCASAGDEHFAAIDHIMIAMEIG